MARRPVSIAPTGAVGNRRLRGVRLMGYNYMDPAGRWRITSRIPRQALWMGTETVSAVGTGPGGIYITDANKVMSASLRSGHRRGRGPFGRGWWSFCDAQSVARPAAFVWTGFRLFAASLRQTAGPKYQPRVRVNRPPCAISEDSFTTYRSWWTGRARALHCSMVGVDHLNCSYWSKDIAGVVYSTLTR